MPRVNLKKLIDSLSTEDLKSYLEKVLRDNPELKQDFVDTFSEQTDIEVFNKSLLALDLALSTIDQKKYIMLCEYNGDVSAPLDKLVSNCSQVIERTCTRLMKLKSYELCQEFLVKAAGKVRVFDLEDIIDLDFDFTEESYGIKQDLFDCLQEWASCRELPAGIRASLKSSIEEIRQDDEDEFNRACSL